MCQSGLFRRPPERPPFPFHLPSAPGALFLLLFLLLLAAARPASAANALQFFFPVDNSLSTTRDDELLVKSVTWSNSAQPVRILLYVPGNGVALDPAANDHGILTEDVRAAVEKAVDEWNSVPFSSFEFDPDVFLSNSAFVDPPYATEAKLDGHNVVTFRSAVNSGASDPVAVTSLFFLERAVNGSSLPQPPADNVESAAGISVDLNGDGKADLVLEDRNYAQGEIIEADVIFNKSVTYRLWPADRDDIPAIDEPFVYGSLDIQALVTHELGHVMGLGHSWLQDPTMYAFLEGIDTDYPTDPYNQRRLAFDDQLAAGNSYPAFSASQGEIRGQTYDGQYFDQITPGQPPNSNQSDLAYVVQAPVFLGYPAPAGAHPDNVPWAGGTMRLAAQVLSGQTLRYPAGTGGVALHEPASTTDPNLDFTDRGEDDNGNGLLDAGEDDDADGVLDLSTRLADGIYRFRGLTPRSDYAVYFDPNLLDLEELLPINPVYNLLTLQESVTAPAEFWGGAYGFEAPPDAAEKDRPLEARLIQVAAGQIVRDVDLVSNIADFPSNSAEFVSISIPDELLAGQTAEVVIRMKNTGDGDWTYADGFSLAVTKDDCGLFPGTRLGLTPAVVAPGEIGTFRGTFTAPAGRAVCSLEFRMVWEFVEFFGPVVPATVQSGYAFETDFTQGGVAIQGWSGGVTLGAGSSYAGPSGLCLSVPAAGDNTLVWVSPERFIELRDNTVWRLRATMATTQTGGDAIPFWNLTYDNYESGGRGNTFGGEIWFLDAAGGAEGVGRSQGLTQFDFWMTPCAVATPQWRGSLADGTSGALAPEYDAFNDLRIGFRVLDIGSADINADFDSGDLCLKSIRVDAFLLDELTFGGTRFDASMTRANYAPAANGQTPLLATIDDAQQAAIYALNTGTDRATLLPYVDHDPPNGAYDSSSLYPVRWASGALYRVRCDLEADPASSGTDPLDLLVLAADTASNEIGTTHFAARGSAGNMDRCGSPRTAAVAGGAQTYLAFLYGHNASRTASLASLRPLADFFNHPSLYGEGTGADGFRVTRLAVDSVSAPR